MLASLFMTCSYFWLQTPTFAAETVQTEFIELFKSWLEEIEALGAFGPGLFIVTVVLGEMIPLLPTQPLCLAAGLLFGGLEGALFVLIGVSIAAILAFSLSRQFGDSLVKQIIRLEEGTNENNGTNGMSMITSRFQGIQNAVKGGGLWQQFVAVLFLRLTPVTPYSISNYVLGLTPLRLEAFAGGTVVGMAVWSLLYASIGGASRVLLKGGDNIEALMQDLGEKAAGITEEFGLVVLSVAVVALVIYYARKQKELQNDDDDDDDVQGQNGFDVNQNGMIQKDVDIKTQQKS
eukprot:TRINITY_DN3295_c1_g1_i7.p2 TRINITY_DN3295_c1_g1~~TRINITY_DN3295_c1_g1_i7.p2  ORF type:complete len:291 (-),score=48.16 TRINITY_DN3295_c1_g1_i7:32-904(-)